MPVRSNFGYHIIKVHEIRTAKPRLHVAHIFVRAPESLSSEESATARTKIFSIYDNLQKGAAFETIAMTESDDKSSGIKGGELPWFSSGEMIPVFENTAYSIKEPGLYSQPVQSFYGWHIIKLLDREELKSYEEERPGLIQMFSTTDRIDLKQRAYIMKLKKDYQFTFYQDNLNQIYNLVDSTIFTGKWNHTSTLKNNDILFTIGDKMIRISDFGKYLYTRQRATEPYNLVTFINNQFKAFCDSELLEYETAMLPKKYPEFAQIVQEYHDGILLFDLTDKEVWSKAVTDTSGLEKFYKQNKKKYMWGERVEAFIISSNNKEIINKALILSEKKGKKKIFTENYLKKQVCPMDTSVSCLTFIYGKFEAGDNEEIDLTNWQEGTVRNYERKDETGFVYIRKKLAPEVKKLNEARGLILADYQSFLEDAWIRSLKNKYSIRVNYELLKKLKYSNV
jgi:peptidyl-prolyl cis-trans isomerase SurA